MISLGRVLLRSEHSSLTMPNVRHYSTQTEKSIYSLFVASQDPKNLKSTKYEKKQYRRICKILSTKQSKLRVCTFNMLHTNFEERLGFDMRWSKRIGPITILIEQWKPDVLGVQELSQSQLSDLYNRINKDYHFHSMSYAERENNGIFYRKERLALLDGKALGTKGKCFFAVATLEDRHNRNVFTVGNTHLPFRDKQGRRAHAEFIAKKIKEYVKQNQVILTGDFNMFPPRLELNLPAYDGEVIHDIIRKAGLTDSREKSVLGHFGPIHTYCDDFLSDREDHKKAPYPVFLDRIFVTDGIEVIAHAVDNTKVDGNAASDHYPVVADLVLGI